MKMLSILKEFDIEFIKADDKISLQSAFKEKRFGYFMNYLRIYYNL